MIYGMDNKVKNKQFVNYSIMRSHLNNPNRSGMSSNSDKDSVKSLVSSFRQGALGQNNQNSKFKTSKNSPERVLLDPKNQKVKYTNNINANITVNLNSNTYINNNNGNHLNFNPNDTKNNFENWLKRKIIKMKEKKSSISIANTNNNSLTSKTLSNTINNHSTMNSMNHHLLQGNYASKMKGKFTNKNVNETITTQWQRRSCSTIDNEHNRKYNKNYYYYNNSQISINNSSNATHNNSNKYTSSSTSKPHSNIKSPFKTSHKPSTSKGNNNSNNNNTNSVVPAHIKNSSILSSTLTTLAKKKYSGGGNSNTINANSTTFKQVPKFNFEMKGISKTSYPSKQGSPKHSVEKNKNNSNSNNKIAKNIIEKNHNKGYSELPSNYNKYNNYINVKREVEGGYTAKEKDRCYFGDKSKYDIEVLTERVSGKNNSDNNISISKIKEKYSNKNSVCSTNNNNNTNNPSSSNINNDNKNLSINAINTPISIKNKSAKEKELKYKDLEMNKNNSGENYVRDKKSEKMVENHMNGKDRERERDKMKDKENEWTKLKDKGKDDTWKSLKLKEPDEDWLTNQDLNDSLLQYINATWDLHYNTNTNNMNESFDSIHSSLKCCSPIDGQKWIFYSRDKDIISNYIQKHFQKFQKYPKTKMKFYKYGRLLGKGAFGKVNLSLHVWTGRWVAIKSLNKIKISERQKSKIAQETSILKSLSHCNYIVKIFETFETKKHICIVTEYICAGDLLSYIRKRSKLVEPIAKYIFKQIVLSLQYIHNHGIVHRDIKLDNILIDLDNNIKVCDFGVSRRINRGDVMMEQCGTPAYIAPEILKNKGYEGYGVDVWSAGVVLYAMWSGTVPFKGSDLNNLHELIMKGNFTQLTEVSKEATHLINALLEVDPKKRISVSKILSHPWWVNVDVNNNTTKLNLFTNAERVLLAKSNVDYRNKKYIDDMIENFTIKNLDTREENETKNAGTKSIIWAPFNSSMTETSLSYSKRKSLNKDVYDVNNKEWIVKNDVIKFSAKVKELNRNYEWNNNGEIDNGIIISPNDSSKNKKDDNTPNNNGSFYSKVQSKPFSPAGELKDDYCNSNRGSTNNAFNEQALIELNALGYSKSYVLQCWENKEINYATASYYLLVKYISINSQ